MFESHPRRTRSSRVISARTGAALLLIVAAAGHATAQCPDYVDYSRQKHEPFSTGRHRLSYMRPAPECRTFRSNEVDDLVERVGRTITDPDLARLFENAYPNTLDTAIKWRGFAADDPREELTFVITGDIDAMWLRDSANQMLSYLPVLKMEAAGNSTSGGGSGNGSIAGLYRGVINLQARYIITSPYCNSFQAPPESGIPPAQNGAAKGDNVKPTYSNQTVFECKYELDSLASFLEVSATYFEATRDLEFFGKFKWIGAVGAVMKVAREMMTSTYGPDGKVLESPYKFTRESTRATETLANDGVGSPVAAGTGLIRSAFRPSDDSTIFQLFIPANMMFASYLGRTAEIVALLGDRAPPGLADDMKVMSKSLREAISKHGITGGSANGSGGGIYAYEVDGFGSAIIMDDANIPSLLSAPLSGYLGVNDTVYQNTRAVVLDQGVSGVNGNPYFMRGPVINAVGGPHAGLGYAWPMASVVRILTSDDDREIIRTLGELVSSTDGLGLMHESVNSHNQSDWTRQWFSWANGLFGQMILDLHQRKPHILKQSFQ